MSTIGIINYGMGNLTSVKNAIEFVGGTVLILNSAEELFNVEKAILPGVGAFGMAIQNLRNNQWEKAIKEYVSSEKPLLGLCLGMQLLLDESDEHGMHKGLGLVSGKVSSLSNKVADLPVPHMGWNNLVLKNESPLTFNLDPAENDVYFVHSYYCKLDNPSEVIATCHYGIEIDVMLQKDNIYGCQFHPEKSQKNGLQIIENFVNL
jgi:glutamine amidotransferase